MIEEIPAPPPTVYPAALGKVLLLLLGSLGFVAIGTAFLLADGGVVLLLVGLLCVSFFGLTAVIYAGKLVRRRPELVLDADGLQHVQLGRIAWAEIAAVRVLPMGPGTRVLELVLHDPAAYLARAPRLTRLTASANRGMGFSPTMIPANTLSADPAEVVAAMVRHHPQLQHRP